ncbi:MAG: hypothetical protein ACRD3E_07870, partial [Terriglobales bacterium]
VLYEMLGGRRAFQRDSSAETMTAILKDDPPELATAEHAVAPAFERIVRRCLEKEAEQRFQSAKDLAFALEAVTGTTSATVKASTVRATRQVRAWIAAVMVLIAVVATAAVLRWNHPVAENLFQYHRVTYARGRVSNARFAGDGETIVYTAAWDGKPKDLYTVGQEFPDSRAMAVPGATALLAVSSKNELAVLVRDHYLFHYEYVGTLATVPLGGGAPREIADNVHAADFSPDGQSMAIVRHTDNNEALEYPIGAVLYKTGGWISNPRISPDGKSILFVEHPVSGDDRGYVQLIDIASRKLTRLTPEFSSLQLLVWKPDGSGALFSGARAAFNRLVFSLDLRGNVEEKLALPTGVNVFDIARDGRLLIASETQSAIVTVYFPDGSSRDLPYLDTPTGPFLTRDGKNVVFADDSDMGGKYYSVMIRKVDGSPPAKLGDGSAIGVSYDGKWLLSTVYTEPAKLMLLPTGAGVARELPRGNIVHYFLGGFFPDGRHVLFSGDEPGKQSRIYVQDTAGGSPTALTPEGYTAVFDPVAPDGKSFVAQDASGQMVLFASGGGTPVVIPNTTEADWPVGWSTDGDHLYFYSVGETDEPVYKLDVHTGARTLVKRYLPHDSVGIVASSWISGITPDGKTFVFSPRNELNVLYVADKQKQ